MIPENKQFDIKELIEWCNVTEIVVSVWYSAGIFLIKKKINFVAQKYARTNSKDLRNAICHTHKHDAQSIIVKIFPSEKNANQWVEHVKQRAP